MIQKSYNIKKVCQITGLNPNTLRTWERRYNIFEPIRSGTGRRLYTDEDIEKIRCVAQLVFEGHAISNLSGLSLQDLQRMTISQTSVTPTVDPIGSSARIKENHLTEIHTKLSDHLTRFELKDITRMIEQCRYRLSPEDFILRIVVPVMDDIGQKIDQGYFTIAQEHAISAIIKFELVKLLSDLRSKEFEDACVAIISTPEGEYHIIGAICASILFANQGWKIFCLGANLPTDALIHASQALNPDVIAISNVNPEMNQFRIPQDVQKILENCPNSQLWLGGRINTNLAQLKSEPRLAVVNNFEALIEKVRTFERR